MESIIVTLENSYSPEVMSKILQVYASELSNVNSLYVRRVDGNYVVKFNIHKNDKFNGVKLSANIKAIIDHILLSNADNNAIVYYVQSGLDVLDKMYEPLMISLTNTAYSHWGKYIDYEDLLQMCKLSLCKLYKAGYYIHKSVLKQAYERDVLMALRRHANEPILVSLTSNTNDEGTGTISDEVADTRIDNKKQDEDDTNALLSVYKTLEPIIIDAIGERRFKILMMNLENKSCDGADRMLLTHRLRSILARKGYTTDWFKRKLGGE